MQTIFLLVGGEGGMGDDVEYSLTCNMHFFCLIGGINHEESVRFFLLLLVVEGIEKVVILLQIISMY